MRRLKIILWITPVVLSSLLISAHFLRHGRLLLMGLGLVPLVALLIPRPWAVRLIQVILLLATLTWVHTTYFLLVLRIRMGLSYGKLLMIMGSVTLFTFLSVFVFRSNILKDSYRL